MNKYSFLGVNFYLGYIKRVPKEQNIPVKWVAKTTSASAILLKMETVRSNSKTETGRYSKLARESSGGKGF